MKIKVQIDSVFQEEMLQIQAPSRTPKIQQVVEFVESLDDNQRLRGKKDGETYLIEPNAISRIYIENRQVLAETIQGEYLRLTSLSSFRKTAILLYQNFTIRDCQPQRN